MKNVKRWIAAMLTAALAIGECGMAPVLAAEDTMAAEVSVSENDIEDPQTDEEDNTVPDETPDEPESVSENGMETAEDTEPELPALHIGQTGKGEELPGADDSGFVYDLPISFEQSDSLILFVNYGIDTISGQEEEGTLVWSILRGEQGRAAGTTSLVQEDDDWTGFEVVSDSPYFIMTEIEEESGSYKMVELASEEMAEQDEYDYYIRAAYYLTADGNQDEAFYAAATVPFLPLKDDADTEQEDATDTEETDEAEEDMSALQGSDQEETENDVLTGEEDDAQEASADADIEDSEADMDVVSTLSENDLSESVAALSEEEMAQAEEEVTNLTLDITSITMQIGDTQQVTASTEPENKQVTWDSGNETVATVDGNGTITAKAEGITQITAMCGDKEASVRVEVAPADSNDKLVDLSGDIWVAGFQRESEDFVYTGQKITQDIRVYYKDTLLKEKTDYTLSYKNNVNAAVYSAAKAPSVTINLKGQYSGSVTLYYTINPLDINQIDGNNGSPDDADGSGGNQSPGYEQTITYARTLKIPSPALTFGKKKLAVNKDFVCDYTALTEQLNQDPNDPQADYKNGDSYIEGKVYEYTVNGIGNFTGSFQMQLVVLKDKNLDFGSAAVTLGQKQYEYHGEALSKADVTINQVKIKSQILDPNLYDYEVCAQTIEGAYVTVYPSEAGREAGYRGSKKVSLKLTGDRNIKDAAQGDNWKAELYFSQKTVDKYGGIYQAKTGVLKYETNEGSDTLTEGKDYTVKYSTAKKVGTVTATFTGKGRYKGSVKWKYKILPYNNTLRITWGKNVTVEDGVYQVAYQKGGAVPELIIKDQEYNVLKNKTDYTVKFKDNKEPGKLMSCEITGKGNYKGYTETVNLMVTFGDISLASLSVADKPYSTKANAWKSAVTILDVNGKKLTAGTDYEKETIQYTYDNMESGQVPQIGAVVTVTVSGTGCYDGSSITGSYRIYDKSKSISKLKIVIDPQEYTGEEITLSSGDIHVYLTSADAKKKQNEIEWESCCEITGYKNNIKAGTAKVTLRGIGEYGGTKTYSFKIQKRTYRVNRVKGIKLDKTNFAVRLADKEVRLTATITAEEEWESISNPIIIWSTSNSNIASVETDTVGGAVATVTLKKEGNVTITAVTQDGNKKAQCKITIVDVPILKEADQTIEGEVGDTYQLTVLWEETQTPDPSKLKWESSNTDKVTVDENGLVTMKAVGAAVIQMRAGTSSYVQQCYIVVKGEEVLPEGSVLTYEQPEGCTDDTAGINQLLQKWEDAQNRGQQPYDYLYLPAGVYWIDPVGGTYESGDWKPGGIVLRSNQTLIMSPSALIMTIGNSEGGYHVIWASDRENVTISGGQIIGDRENHSGTGGESGHGIQIDGCTNVKIENVEVSKCWGDGIYVGATQSRFSKQVTITNCDLHHNCRSNLSITEASDVTVNDSKFSKASGKKPEYGINIEPNAGKTCSNVTITNSTFAGNAGGTIQILGQLNAHVKGVKIENCTGDKAPVQWSGFGGSVSGVTEKNNKWGN